MESRYLSWAMEAALQLQAILRQTFQKQQWLKERKDSGHFMVVTKDRAVTQMARGLGSRVMKPQEFMGLLKIQAKDNEQILFSEKVKSHGFNRPFQNIKLPIE